MRLSKRIAKSAFSLVLPTCVFLIAQGTSVLAASGSTATPDNSGTPVAAGQPNQSCGSASAPNTPGSSASAPGSAFNPNGTAGTVYAGQQPQNSVNPASVSQYDVACSHAP